MIALRWERGDRCSFKGTLWRVAYVTVDRTVALIVRDGRVRNQDAIIVDINQLDLAIS